MNLYQNPLIQQAVDSDPSMRELFDAAGSLLVESLEARPQSALLKVDADVPAEVTERLLRNIGTFASQHYNSASSNKTSPSEPSTYWCRNLPAGATFYTWSFDHGDYKKSISDIEKDVSKDPTHHRSTYLELAQKESLALLPVRTVELCRSTLKCQFANKGQMDGFIHSADRIETVRCYQDSYYSDKYVLVTFGPKTPENDKLAADAMHGFARTARAIESPKSLEARFEQYISDGMDRKLLKGFARDIVDCMVVEGLKPEAQIGAYLKVFERFALHEAAKRLEKFNNANA